jgi:hypothetical protein
MKESHNIAEIVVFLAGIVLPVVFIGWACTLLYLANVNN